MSSYKLVKAVGQAAFWETFKTRIKSADAFEAELTKTGSYDELLANIPLRGDVLSGWGGYSVTSAVLDRHAGQMGTLVINLVGGPWTGDSAGGPDQALSRKIHLKWREINVGLFDGYYKAFGSDVNVALLQCWQSEPDPALKATYQVNTPVLYGSVGSYVCKYVVQTLTDSTLALAKRILAGETSYKIAMPVVVIVERFSLEPSEVKGPFVATSDQLKFRFPRIANNTLNRRGQAQGHVFPSAKYIPTANQLGTAYQWICLGVEVEDGEKGWTRTWEWQGALPPQGCLGNAWGSGKAFDPNYYPPSAQVPPGATLPQGARKAPAKPAAPAKKR